MNGKTRTLLFLFTVAAPALGAAGCVVSRSDDATMYVNWTVEDDRGVRMTCTEVGGETVHLDLLNLDSEQDFHSQFPCRAKYGVSGPLPAGEYRVALRLRNAAGDAISELVFPRTFLVYRDRQTDLGAVVFQAYPADQYFALEWSIVKDANNVPLTCAQADGVFVDLTTTDSTGKSLTYRFTCEQMSGRTTTVNPGAYNLEVDLLNSKMASISRAQMTAVTVQQGAPTVLPHLIFGVN